MSINNLHPTYNYWNNHMTLMCIESAITLHYGMVALFIRLNDLSYVVASFINSEYEPIITWGQSHYFVNLKNAVDTFFILIDS